MAATYVKEIAFPTYEEAKTKNPNLDLGSYGLHALEFDVATDPKCQKIKAQWERSSAQPASKIKNLRFVMNIALFTAQPLVEHLSPLVRAKAKKEVQDAIDALTALLKA